LRLITYILWLPLIVQVRPLVCLSWETLLCYSSFKGSISHYFKCLPLGMFYHFFYLGREITVPQPLCEAGFSFSLNVLLLSVPSYLLYLKQSYICHPSLYIPRVISDICSLGHFCHFISLHTCALTVPDIETSIKDCSLIS
jgi:hypothetical protein